MATKPIRLVVAVTCALTDGQTQDEGAVRQAMWDALDDITEIYPQDEDRADESTYSVDVTSIDILP